MYRPAARAALRSSQSSLAPARTVASRRFVSTEPPHMKSRSWRSSAIRWGLAAAGIYYYNTSALFTERPQNHLLNPNVDALDDDGGYSTLDALTASSRKKAQQNASVLQSAIEQASDRAVSDEPATATSPQATQSIAAPAVGVADLEDEAEGEGAFNPVTGEINWDCPCLGGMAHGPCGPEFREAFSCFVYSQEEPKGMDCIEKFQKMQTCFRAHPEVYSDELEGDEELDEGLAQEKQELEQEISERRAAIDAKTGGSSQDRTSSRTDAGSATTAPKKEKQTSKSELTGKRSRASSSGSSSATVTDRTKSDVPTGQEAKAKIEAYTEEDKHDASSTSPVRQPKTSPVADAISEADDLVPKAAHDARENKGDASKAGDV